MSEYRGYIDRGDMDREKILRETRKYERQEHERAEIESPFTEDMLALLSEAPALAEVALKYASFKDKPMDEEHPLKHLEYDDRIKGLDKIIKAYVFAINEAEKVRALNARLLMLDFEILPDVLDSIEGDDESDNASVNEEKKRMAEIERTLFRNKLLELLESAINHYNRLIDSAHEIEAQITGQ